MPKIGGAFDSAGSAGSSVTRPVARHGTPVRGVVRLGALGLEVPEDEVRYHVYANSGGGDPINYADAIATTSTNYRAGGLAPGIWKIGVRAFDSNGEEQNLDCALTIRIDDKGNDITNLPFPPTGLRAFAAAGGGVRVEWWYPATSGPKKPTGFHVYIGTDGSPSYVTPITTVLYSSGIFSSFQANLLGTISRGSYNYAGSTRDRYNCAVYNHPAYNSTLGGLTDGVTYSIGVRAYNSSGEEQNTTVVTVTADTTGPAGVDLLTAIAIV